MRFIYLALVAACCSPVAPLGEAAATPTPVVVNTEARRSLSCESNEIQREEGPNGALWRAAVVGDFAGPPFLTLNAGSAHKTSWALRNSAPRPYIVLIIERVGGRDAPLRVEAIGARVDGIALPRAWGGGYGYNYDLSLPVPGCWRVRWDGDPPSRYLTYEVEPAQR